MSTARLSETAPRVECGASELSAANQWECPICGAQSTRLFLRHGYWVRRCTRCAHRFAEIAATLEHVERVYDDEYFYGGGAGYVDYLSEADLLRVHGRQYGALLNRYTTPGRALDVGAAAGFVLEGLLQAGWHGIGIEPNPRMAAQAQARLGVAVHATPLETFTCTERFDVITMIQVVSHFVNLKQALANAAAMTRPGGYWLIETWNRDSWIARLLGKHWHEYSPPSVLHWFSPDGLRGVVAQYGFHEIAHGRPAKWLNGAHAKSLLRYKLDGTALGRIGAAACQLVPDALPIPYPSFDLFWTLFQRTN